MNNRLQFQEKLRGILEMAREQKDRVTTEEVERYFEEDRLTDAQTELVYDYLLSQKVRVSGYEKKGGSAVSAEEADVLTEEEKVYLKEYEHDLHAFRPEADGERDALFGRARQKDALAKSRLIELYLPVVAELAKKHHHPEVFLGDMVQEGNVSLMLALDQLPEEGEDAFLRDEIVQGMQAMAEELQEARKRDNRMVEKVHDLDAGITKLTEEMGRKVTIEELAIFLDMPVEEIVSIMQLAGEDIELEDAAPGDMLSVKAADGEEGSTDSRAEAAPPAGGKKDYLKSFLDELDDMEYEGN